jgi:hypothetical protein
VENDAAHQLNVEVTHPGGSFARLADQSEDFLKLGIEDTLDQNAAFAPVIRQLGSRGSHPFPDGLESTPQGLVIETLDLGLASVDGLDDRLHALGVTLVLRTEDEFYTFLEQIHRSYLADGKMPGRPPAHGSIQISATQTSPVVGRVDQPAGECNRRPAMQDARC